MKKMKLQISLLCLLIAGPIATFAQSWEKIYTGYNYIYRGIEFPEGQNLVGYAGGQSITYYGNGIVVKTIDGGSTWSQMWTGTQLGVEGISFPDLNHGYICGWTQSCSKTGDGGITWTPLTPTAPANVYYYTDVVFKDSIHGIVAAAMNGSFAAGMFVTSDGGITWTPGTGMADEMPYKMCYVTDNTYFMITNNGTIHKSTDGGLTWSQVATSVGFLLGVNFYNSLIGIVTSEDGLFFKTFDGGVTWQPQITAFGNPLWRSTAWKNQNELIMVGTPETIWKSMNGGSTWENDYPTSAYNGAMYDILYTPQEYWYSCGSQGFIYRKAPLLVAAFTASNTTICNGSIVQFTDQSIGSPTGWSWAFEGGTPATSNDQNPTVTYSSPGVYDVSLTVTRLTNTNTLSNPDMILVEGPLSTAPAQPSGPTAICGTFNYDYTTTSVPQATSYSWVVEPATTGTMTGTGLTGTLQASNVAGAFTIKVAGINSCGAGSYSSLLNGTLTFQPVTYSLMTGGGYCSGQPGFEIQLEDSDAGVSYQLFKDGVASGSPVTGTGTQLSFGFQTAGAYTVSAANGTCSSDMQGIAYVILMDPPATAVTPTGPTSVCNDVAATYSALLPANSTSLIWTIDPASAGILTQPTATTATIVWEPGFSGNVSVTVQGNNECGTGPSSNALTVQVNPIPEPVVTGNASVCRDQQISYTTTPVAGSTYNWLVTGGSIIMGQGTADIEVLWATLGNGTVAVNETSPANCSGTSVALDVVVSECTSRPETTEDNFIIYPNPVSDLIHIHTEMANFNVRLINQLGQVVRNYVFENKSIQAEGIVEVHSLNEGIYYLQITTGNEAFTKMIIKQ